MKTTIIKTLFFISCFIFTPSIYAIEKGVIVVSNDVDISHLSKNDLKNIFLGRKTLWSDGKRIQIGLSAEDSAKLDNFLVNNIGKNKRRFKKYWLKKVFAGYGVAPRIFTNNTKAIEFAKSHENTITYITIDGSNSIDGIKVIDIDGKKIF